MSEHKSPASIGACWCGRRNTRSRETGYCTARHADQWRNWTPGQRRIEVLKAKP